MPGAKNGIVTFYWISLDKVQYPNYSFFLMSLVARSLISLNKWSLSEIQQLLSLAQQYKSFKIKSNTINSGKLVSLAFFEPSTRTKLSFQTAIGRLGIQCSDLGTLSDSSMVKGESFLETLMTIEAMEPDILILRSNASESELGAIKSYKRPIINAGCGSIGHPTQALADALTMSEKTQLNNLKILFIGDIRHSRVVKSNIELLKKFPEISFGFCGPKEFLPEEGSVPAAVYFDSLGEALSWCDFAMALRVQKERHENESFDVKNYQKNYCLTLDKVNNFLRQDAFIMHPGPHVENIDLDPQIFSDRRCLIRDQVTNGVYTRMALVHLILGLNKGKENEG